MAVTTYEKGIEKGIEEGLERGRDMGRQEGRQEGREEATISTMRRMVSTLLQEKFPRVPAKLRKRVDTLAEDELMALATRVSKAVKLDDLEF